MKEEFVKKETSKDRILCAALNLFSEKGYDGTGVDSIAEMAGLKGSSLYRHFKGKEDIFNSLICMLISRYTTDIAAFDKEENYPKSLEELKEIALESIQFMMHDDTVIKTRRIMEMEQFRSERMAELTTLHQYELIQKKLTEIFKCMMKKGILKQENPEYLALAFVAPASMLIHTCDRQPEKEQEIFEKLRFHFDHFTKEYGM